MEKYEGEFDKAASETNLLVYLCKEIHLNLYEKMYHGGELVELEVPASKERIEKIQYDSGDVISLTRSFEYRGEVQLSTKVLSDKEMFLTER